MNLELTPQEIRVIGALIEKEITTPEQYPLSLNALTNACNQKSNREPVVEWADGDVQTILDDLARKHLVSAASGYGSRVAKYQQRFCNGQFGGLQFSAQELAILCELFLRGAQTPGELRSRASRMAGFADVGEVETALKKLLERDDGPFVERLAREPGKRESRYRHLFCGGAVELESAPSGEALDDDRLAALERRVAELEAEVVRLNELCRMGEA